METPRQRKLRRLGMIALPNEPDLPVEIRRQLVADFCKLVAARQDVATRSTKVKADLSSGERTRSDSAATGPRRQTTLPYHGTVAASFPDDDAAIHGFAGGSLQAAASAKSASPTITDRDARALSPRLLQTLDGLLNGDSEKQIALKLCISKHTVHAYVKMLYRRYGANSRGELLARWVRR